MVRSPTHSAFSRRAAPRKIAILGMAALLAAFALSSATAASALTLSSNWNLTSSYPGANNSLSDQSCVTDNGYLYCVGGINGNDLTVQSTYYAQLSNTGGITGSWQQTTDYGPGALSDGSCVSYDGYITCVAGWCTSVDASQTCFQVQGPSAYSASAPLSSTGIGSWTQSSATLPDTIFTGQAGGIEGVGYGDSYNSCVQSGGYVYCIGGLTETTVISGYGDYTVPIPIPTSSEVDGVDIGTNVFAAQLSPTGGIQGSWGYGPGYGGGAAYDLACVASGGYIYCVGGDLDSNPTTGLDGGLSAGSTSATNQVWSAQVLSGGGLGSWQQTTSYPQSLDGLSCAALGAYIYCAGGGGSDTYYAQLNAGTVGPWFSGSSYPTSVYNPQCVSGTGYAYCVGGTTTDDVAYTIGNNLVLSDANSCTALGGVWNGASSTCTLSTSLNLSIFLEIASGTTLDIAGSGSLTTSGSLSVDSGGTLTNAGMLTNDAFFTNVGGHVTNSGTFLNDPGVTVETTGTFTNSGTLNNQGAFDITIINGNQGLLVNSGTVSTTGSGSIVGFEFSIENSCGGSVTGTQPPAGAIRNVPCAPTITTASGMVSLSGSPVISGTEDLASNSGFPVTIYIGQGCFLCTDYIASTSTDSSGDWSVAVPLAPGTYTLFAQASPDSSYASEFDSLSSNTITITVDHNLDQATCTTPIGGTWSSATSTCVSTRDVTIAAADSLQVGSGVTFDNQDPGQMMNYGSLANLGTITNSNGFYNEAGGSFTDSGTFNEIAPGSVVNDGTFTVNLNGATCASYPLMASWNPGAKDCTVSSALTIGAGYVLQVPGGTTFSNTASLTNSGTIQNSGTVANACGGTVSGNAVSGNPVEFAPCAPVVTTPDDSVFLAGSVTLAGTSNLASNGGAAMTITLYAGSNAVGSATTGSGGAWTVSSSSLSPGEYSLYVTATSSASIASPPSNEITATFQFLDQDSCVSPLGGDWTANVCDITGTFSMPEADSLEIPAGTTLTVSSTGTFDSNGAINDLGTISNDGSLSNAYVLVSNELVGGTLTDAGMMTNSGTFLNEGTLTVGPSGVFTNNGQLTDGRLVLGGVSSGGFVSISSGGSFTNSLGATMTDQTDSLVENAGAFTNGGVLNSGIFSTFEGSGSLINSGAMTLDGTVFESSGPVTNTAGGTISIFTDATGGELAELNLDSGGSLDNHGTLSLTYAGEFYADSGTLVTNEIGGTITDQFEFTLISSLTNYGTFDNAISPAIASLGAGGGEFSGNARIIGTFTNHGTFSNADGGATFTIDGGVFDNYAVVTNLGSMTNSGTLNEYCGGSFSGTPLSGTPAVALCPTTSEDVGTTTLEQGGATDQSSVTGIGVTISGSSAPDGTNVTVTTSDLSSRGPGVEVSGLGSPQYYDVSIVGIADGTARVCITTTQDPSGLTMQYWDGTTWVTAANISVSDSTVICGDMPVSALLGTNIALGTGTGGTGGSPPTGVPEFPASSIAVAALSFACVVFLRRSRGPRASSAP